MVLRSESTYELDVKDESPVEAIRQKIETETYVLDLLSELQSIAGVGGLEALSRDIDTIVSRHQPAVK